ncbi:MAG: SoxR reducing system RseC family protein [Nitrospirae bacterium]|nr:SoxR reducing system RseC family protein [Nitrospirota bacterium]
MKTNIVETGVVIEKNGTTAKVLLGKGTSCRGCAMAKLGMCRPGGANMIFTVDNTINAEVGDTVMLGLKREVHWKGYFIAFVLPLLVFVVASVTGYVISLYTGIEGIEVLSGFVGLAFAIIFSINRLKRMDSTERMHIKRVVRERQEMGEFFSGAEGIDYLKGFQTGKNTTVETDTDSG